jgi:para-aminobenzoate synthetase component I
MLSWCKQFSIFCFLDTPSSPATPIEYDFLIGVGRLHSIGQEGMASFQQLEEFKKQHTDWLFGHLSYDLKNQVETLKSANPSGIQFPDLFFFHPEVVLIGKKDTVSIGSFSDEDNSRIIKTIARQEVTSVRPSAAITLSPRFSKGEYITAVEQIQWHIQRGDCYELNFCQEFHSTAEVNPVSLFTRLTEASPNPFSALYRLHDQYLVCASPERFIKLRGEDLISQPIKGTARREGSDEVIRKQLLHDPKERSENIMITDLVRNDLSKVSKEGTVEVEELLGVYSFPHVHQMITTVKGTAQSKDISAILKATFPMGSMTGAPKKRVMELIEQYERTKRGIFSGSVGYITPEGDFDFNVVIRSIMYNATTNYLSVQAGSAITFYSDAEKEYEECLLKIAAIERVLGKATEIQHA